MTSLLPIKKFKYIPIKLMILLKQYFMDYGWIHILNLYKLQFYNIMNNHLEKNCYFVFFTSIQCFTYSTSVPI